MSWRFHEPMRCEYDTESDYQEALEVYLNALDDYVCEAEERHKAKQY